MNKGKKKKYSPYPQHFSYTEINMALARRGPQPQPSVAQEPYSWQFGKKTQPQIWPWQSPDQSKAWMAETIWLEG